MSISYDAFLEVFLAKASSYEFYGVCDYERNEAVNGYMKRSIAAFRHICKYDLVTTGNDLTREFNVEIAAEDIDELLDIISEGMLVQWLKPYVYKQDNLEVYLNTRDFTAYSPSELLYRIKDTYKDVQRNFVNMMREYSYNHGDLTDLHL